MLLSLFFTLSLSLVSLFRTLTLLYLKKEKKLKQMWEITWWIFVRNYILFFKKLKHELPYLFVAFWTPPESLWTVNEKALVVLESITNSTMSICMSRNHSITLNKPKASPTGTKHKGETCMVLARTKTLMVTHAYVNACMIHKLRKGSINIAL